MSLSMSTKIFIFLVVISLIAFVYFRDRYAEPESVKNADNSTSLQCNQKDGYILRQDPSNQSHIQCYKEAGFGHTKITFLIAMAMAMWTGVGIVFYIEYKKRDETSVLIYLVDRYQTENKPIPKCPDVHYEKGFVWTYEGYDKVICSTEPRLHIGTRKMISPVGKNLIFKGAREELSPLELFRYIGKDKKFFKKITGADISGYMPGALIRNEGNMPKIYFPRPLPYETMRSYYSLKGNYGFESERFSVVIGILLKMKKSITFLDKKMHFTFKSMMQKGEEYVAATARTGMEADKTRRTDAAESSRQNPEYSNSDERRSM